MILSLKSLALALALLSPCAGIPSDVELMADRFGTDPAKRSAAVKQLSRRIADEKTRSLALAAHRESPLHQELKKDWEQKIVRTADRTSPYLWRTVGKKPEGGWPLVIAMHGGGGVPKPVNDREWQQMFNAYYKDHPEVGGYLYLALRAPNDVWNGFYDDSISPLVETLIKQFVLFAEVNPSRVYTLGASHGGYGAFVIGPKIPYRFAAVHASASAPTPGETRGENLRNTRFTFMVGERDTAYGRADLCQKFQVKVEEWRKQYGGFPGAFEFLEKTGHFVRDHDKLAEMVPIVRDALPKRVVWTQTDAVIKRFYWIESSAPVDEGRIKATVEGNTIRIRAEKQKGLVLWLSPKLLDVTKPIRIEIEGGKTTTVRLKSSLEDYCASLESTADAELACEYRVVVF